MQLVEAGGFLSLQGPLQYPNLRVHSPLSLHVAVASTVPSSLSRTTRGSSTRRGCWRQSHAHWATCVVTSSTWWVSQGCLTAMATLWTTMVTEDLESTLCAAMCSSTQSLASVTSSSPSACLLQDPGVQQVQSKLQRADEINRLCRIIILFSNDSVVSQELSTLQACRHTHMYTAGTQQHVNKQRGRASVAVESSGAFPT